MKYLAIPLLAFMLMGMVPADSGIEVSAEDAVRCMKDGCTVWTEGELQMLVKLSMLQGIEIGQASCIGSTTKSPLKSI